MEVEKAFKRLLIKSPFYGLFCLGLPKELTNKTPTLCIAKQGLNTALWINPEFWKKHTDDEQIALLQHELSHICLQHPFISESFDDLRTFNIAADMEVNSYIENLPSCACLAKDIGLENCLGTKTYYEHLKNPNQQKNQNMNPNTPCNGGSGSNNQQQSSSQENNDNKEDSQYPDNAPQGKQSIDDHSTWKQFKDIPEAAKQLIQNNINRMLKQTAEQVEKQCGYGSIPGEFREIIEKLREKKPEIFNWKAYFRRLLGSIYDVNIKTTRRKESKRFEGAAGVQHKKKVSILVAVDTSGSVATSELQEFFSEIEYIYKAGARVTILECDTQINKIVEYDGRHLPEIIGRGGTDFNPPVEYYIKHKREYASLIYFTDGECSLPNKHPSGMVWVITSNGYHQDYPGRTIYIPKNNDKY